MAYRDDPDALAHQRARDDEQAHLLASFRRGERARSRRAIASWLGGLLVVGSIYGVSLAGPVPRHHRHVAEITPQSIALRVAADFEYAAAKQRARVRRAMQAYLTAIDADQVDLINFGFDPDPAASQGMQPFNPNELELELAPSAAPGSR